MCSETHAFEVVDAAAVMPLGALSFMSKPHRTVTSLRLSLESAKPSFMSCLTEITPLIWSRRSKPQHPLMTQPPRVFRHHLRLVICDSPKSRRAVSLRFISRNETVAYVSSCQIPKHQTIVSPPGRGSSFVLPRCAKSAHWKLLKCVSS
jgi:hypothetical protein